jgi:two-component system, sensor histidine kinase PdtaS
MNLSGLRLLLVEDDRIIALSETQALKREGFSVYTANNGAAAVDLVESGEPEVDLVLMDIDLGPGMDGTEAARRILALKSLPILFLSSHAEAEIVERAEKITSYGYVAKNSGAIVMSASIKMAYKLHQAHLELEAKEAALAESQERLGFALEATNDGLWDVNMATKEVYLSPRDCEILGYSFEEVHELVRQWDELVNPEDMPRTLAALNAHLEGRSPIFQVEQRLRMKSGEWKWVYTRGKVVARGKGGEALRMAGIHSDISARKRAESDLEETEELFRSFLERSPVFVFFKDASARVLRLSRNYEAMLGRPIEEMIGKDMFELFPTELSRSMVEDDLRLLREGRIIEVEEELGGHAYSTTKFPIYREGKQPLLAGFTIDITARREAERLLEEALREKETLFEELQHRVKNNLRMMSSLLSLEMNSIPDGKARESFLSAQSRIEALQAIYERLSAGKAGGDVEMGSYLGELAASIVANLCAAGGCELESSLEAVRLPTERAIPIGLIFTELLTNAVKYARAAGGIVRIRVSLKAQGGMIELRVSDNGPGIPAEVDLDAPATLGLKLVSILATQVSGSIAFSSDSGAQALLRFPA